MIISVEELRIYVPTDEADPVLEAKLQALEMLIRSYTHNNFQKRNIRFPSAIVSGVLDFTTNLLKVDDTVQISESLYNDGIYTVNSVNPVTLNEVLIDEDHCLVTKVEYPADIKMGVANLIKWDLERRDKVGVSSETISRHSVTYFKMDGDNSLMGYPRSLLGFLEPYRKARF